MYNDLFPFLEKLKPEERDYLIAGIEKKKFNTGTLVQRTDSGCTGVMAVSEGRLRIYLLSEEGREITLYRVEAGELCILSASCLMDTIIFDVMIEAMEDTQVYIIPTSRLHVVEEQNPEIELFIYKKATEKFSEVMWTMQQLLFMKLDQRIANFLWDESLRQKSTTLQLTHEAIAKEIGSSREVVTKVIKYFVTEGIVSIKRGKIEILNKAGLQNIIRK